jgi:hypothetical protein
MSKRGEMRDAYNVRQGNLREAGDLEDPGVGERIILK